MINAIIALRNPTPNAGQLYLANQESKKVATIAFASSLAFSTLAITLAATGVGASMSPILFSAAAVLMVVGVINLTLFFATRHAFNAEISRSTL